MPRRTTTVRRRLTTAAFVASAVIVGVFGWRWVLVEATTDYGAAEPVAAEPRPVARHAPPPVGVEVTVLDVHTASSASPAATPAKARPAASNSRPRPLSKSAR
ncbi:MAG TPA: hypothetical protein VGD80_14195 [Kofleriaceae bacterium]